jgi:hypothetical protein
VVTCDGVFLEPQPGLDGTVGLITLATALTGRIEASYSCTYFVTVWTEAESLYAEQNFAAGLYSQEGLTLREFLA